MPAQMPSTGRPLALTTSPRRSSAAGSCAAQGAAEPEITIAWASLRSRASRYGTTSTSRPDAASRRRCSRALQRCGREAVLLGCSLSIWMTAAGHGASLHRRAEYTLNAGSRRERPFRAPGRAHRGGRDRHRARDASPRSAAPGELHAARAHRRARRAARPARARRRPRAHRQRAGEGVERATASAAAGGVTTIVDMPYDAPEPVNTLARFEAKVAHVEAEALVDVALYATVAPSGGLDEIEPLHAAGAAAFKVSTFETHPVRFPRVPDGELLLAMAICARARGARLLPPRERRHRAAPVASSWPPRAAAIRWRTPTPRPPVAESEAIGRALELGRATGCRTHLCHVSIERGFALVAPRARDGVDASAETCTHYLVMDEDDLRRLGGRAKINPPLRRAHSRTRSGACSTPAGRPGHLRPRRLGARAQGHARHLRARAPACPGSRRRCRCSSARASCGAACRSARCCTCSARARPRATAWRRARARSRRAPMPTS